MTEIQQPNIYHANEGPGADRLSNACCPTDRISTWASCNNQSQVSVIMRRVRISVRGHRFPMDPSKLHCLKGMTEYTGRWSRFTRGKFKDLLILSSRHCWHRSSVHACVRVWGREHDLVSVGSERPVSSFAVPRTTKNDQKCKIRLKFLNCRGGDN